MSPWGITGLHTGAPVTGCPVVEKDTVSDVQLEDMYQVVLWNDDHNDVVFVVRCLIQIFGHPEALAVKIMFEAHNNGKAIAEVEGREAAKLHCGQLLSFGLTSTLEKI